MPARLNFLDAADVSRSKSASAFVKILVLKKTDKSKKDEANDGIFNR